MSSDPASGANQPLRVLVVGGGVAAVEAVLALRALAGRRVDIKLMSAEPEFVYKPLAVAEPFGIGTPTRLDLDAFCTEHSATFRQARMSEVDPDSSVVRTESGSEVSYDALLLAIGAQGHDALPGALTFGGSADVPAYVDLLDELTAGTVQRVAFAVPDVVLWALPLYELAMMTSHHLRTKEIEAELTVVTHEPRPLSAFGRRASGEVAELLERSGVAIVSSETPESVTKDGLRLIGGGVVGADRVVAQPGLEVPEIARIPQGRHGFIGTDTEMRVEGTINIWAAGDATWFPIKQGGLAAQQADVAATAIAARAGADVKRVPLRPVIRAAILTGSGPHYLRTGIGNRDELSAAGAEVLWWPPGKIAGRYLAPYLAVHWGGEQPPPPLEDLEAAHGSDGVQAQADHRDAVELALTCADADARWRDYKGALRWLDVAEQLEIVLPVEYAEKRRAWREAVTAKT